MTISPHIIFQNIKEVKVQSPLSLMLVSVSLWDGFGLADCKEDVKLVRILLSLCNQSKMKAGFFDSSKVAKRASSRSILVSAMMIHSILHGTFQTKMKNEINFTQTLKFSFDDCSLLGPCGLLELSKDSALSYTGGPL